MADKTLLNERSHNILRAVIHSYIYTGEPVGSRTVAKKYNMQISAATIRNIMSDLEELGLLSHPHTSAGRVPTDLGYRFFVDHLMDTVKLDEKEKNEIFSRFVPYKERTNDLLRAATDLIAEIGKGMGLAIFPDFASYTFKNIQFVRLRKKRVLSIFVCKTGFVIDKVIDLDEDFGQEDLDRISRFANIEFKDMTLLEIHRKIFQMLGEQRELYDQIVRQSLKFCKTVFSRVDLKDNELIVNFQRLINNPSFSDLRELRDTIKTFEDKHRLLDIITKCVLDSNNSVNVSIGTELFSPDLERFSLVTSAYRYRNQVLGSLGIIGPKRMDYGKTVSMIQYMADLVSDLVTGQARTPDD